MKFTCLSEGKGCHFPPCSILDICGFRIMFDCPLDLSSLSIFSPVPMQWSTVNEEDTSCACHTSLALKSIENKRQKIERHLDGSSLIHAEPWYKAVKSLKLWDASFIDVVLISSPMGMLGLPLLTSRKDFCAKIYATEATIRLGQLMMEDLIAMHKEFRQFYGPQGSNGPEWMKWDEIESLPSAIKEILLGQDGRELGGWLPLYSAADLKDCMEKVQSLKYAEEACYNGTLIIKAFSSGLDIGTCNWSIISPKQNVSYLSSSISASATALNFDYNALRGSDVILFSDFTACSYVEKYDSGNDGCTSLDKYLPKLSDNDKNDKTVAEFLLTAENESAGELEKLSFLCSCSLDCVRAGGSVLIPVGRLGIMLLLLEQIAVSLESSDLKVPILIVSSVAEELLAFLNVIPEWLCQHRQDRLYSGQPLFAHMELLKEKRLSLYPVIHSPKLLANWQEPCIVFCPHWSLRIGPSVHLLRRWCHDENSLLVLEEGVDMDLLFLPFKPMTMKILQCSFLSGMKLQNVKTLLKFLKPKHVLLPEKLRQDDNMDQFFTLGYYSENETLHIPNLKDGSELDIGIDLACRLQFTRLEQEDMSIARVKGELFRERGKIRLRSGNEQVLSSQTRPLLYLGRVNLEILLNTLQKSGMNARVEEVANDDGSEMASFVHVLEPKNALIEVTAAHTVISTADASFASCISEAISSILNCIS